MKYKLLILSICTLLFTPLSAADANISLDLTLDEQDIASIAAEAEKLVPIPQFPPIHPNNNQGNVYNVRDFGAVGDWITDDYPAIQAAVQAAWNAVQAQHALVKYHGASDREASAHCTAVLSFPPGNYRHSQTIIIPPGISIIGTYQKSILMHQASPRGSPDENSFRINDEIFTDFHDKTVQILLLGKVLTAAGTMIHSTDDSVIGIQTETRGDNIAICSIGHAENRRIRDCVLKAFPEGHWTQSSIGIAIARQNQDIQYPWLGQVPKSTTGWLTDGDISGNFFELFEYAIFGPIGQSTIVRDNIFESNRYGIRTFSTTSTRIADNQFHAWPFFVAHLGRPDMWTDTHITLQGTGAMIIGNHFVGGHKAILASGRDINIRNNLYQLTVDLDLAEGYFAEIVSAGHKFTGAKFNEGGIAAGATIGGRWVGNSGYFILNNHIAPYVNPEGKVIPQPAAPVKIPKGFHGLVRDNYTSFQ